MLISMFTVMFGTTVHSAEVYYLGGSSSIDSSQKNKEFSRQKRVEDLVDFQNYGE
jgi:hypothetical protein